MNELIHRLFDERYWKAVRFCNTLHIVYALLCGFIAGFAFTLAILPETPVAVWLSILALPAVCYPLMLFKLFKPWSNEGIKKRIKEAEEKAEGVVLEGMGAMGIFQVNFSYSVERKKYKSSDIFDESEHPRKGETVMVAYNPRMPKSAYIDTTGAIQSR